jgi:predicted dehydrogenase
MAGLTGKNLYVLFDSTVLDTDYRSFGPSEEIGLVDQSAGSDDDRTYLTELKDGTTKITIVIQADDTTTWGALVPGTEGTLEWGEEGTASSKPKHTVNVIVSSREKTIEYADLLVADISFQFSGAVADSAY